MRTLAVFLIAVASAAAQNTLTPEEAAQGWRLLFDGKTMKGWRDPAKKNAPGDAWTIEDGCLKTVARARISEDLLSEESFGNFELKLDWRVAPGGNTGVKYRVQQTVFVDPARNPQNSRSFEAWLGHELARGLALDKTRLSRTVSGLETRGFVQRRVNPRDNRETLISLTKAGERAYARMIGSAEGTNAALLAPFSEEERSALKTLVERLTDRAREILVKEQGGDGGDRD